MSLFPPPLLLSPLDIKFSQTRIRAEFQDGNLVEDTISEIEVVPLPPELVGSIRRATGLAPAAEEGDEPAAESSDAPEDGGGVGDPTPPPTPARSSAPLDAPEDSGAGEPTPPTTPARSAAAQDAEGEAAAPGSEGAAPGALLIKAPFPHIEVIRWRCKLREADGSSKVDAAGLELYSHDAYWFTFDNRRLYALQRLAVQHYPTQVFCEVLEVPTTLAKSRELRKFDTRTFGSKVQIGRRDTEDLPTFCWRVEVGLPEEAMPEDGIAKEPSLRRRRAMNPRPPPFRGNRRPYRRQGGDCEENRGSHWDLVRSATLFCVIYLGLRVAVSLFRQYKGLQGAASEQPTTIDVAAVGA